MRHPYLIVLSVGLVAWACATSTDNVGLVPDAGGGSGAVDGSAGAAATGGSAGMGATGGGGTGGGVLEGAADGPPCNGPTPDSTCDTFPQCGCDMNLKCDVSDNTTGKATCVSNGTVPPYQRCSIFNTCTKGNACIGGVCQPYCDSAADCPGGTGTRDCIQVSRNVGGTATPIPGFLVCTSGCDPLNPGVICGPDTTCDFTNTGVGVTDCQAAGKGVGTGACANNALCAVGYVCVGVTQSDGVTVSNDCLKWCRLSGSDCGANEVCQGLTSNPTYNGIAFGVCLTP